ncbi:hypothetical protein [Sphingobium agri]|uniref:Uncharacterized protein n=1 Tax=Sphingobium agri TaxID=2933566 RepID=A0ABT0DWV5_9SPHN|nr:hypothetical protein [Sphingobium agri]MCK0531432.1 hypothetical protein [Sphingobium agri]
MSSPLERAARALCELAGNPPGATMDGKPLWQDYLPEVRAVLSAIREPSESMERAGWTADLPFTPSIKVGTIWQSMIDAMLKEGA